MDVALDTDIIIKNKYFMDSILMKELFLYLDKNNSKLLISEITLVELKARYLNDIKEFKENTIQDINNLKIKDISEKELSDKINYAIDNYNEYVDNIRKNKNIIIINHDLEIIEEAIKRLSFRIPPSIKSGTNFRDVVIWLSIIKHQIEINRNFSFISKDKKSFFDNNKPRKELLDEITELDIDIEILNSLIEFLNKNYPAEGLVRGGCILHNIENIVNNNVNQHILKFLGKQDEKYIVDNSLDDLIYIPEKDKVKYFINEDINFLEKPNKDKKSGKIFAEVDGYADVFSIRLESFSNVNHDVAIEILDKNRLYITFQLNIDYKFKTNTDINISSFEFENFYISKKEVISSEAY
jgi:hypothetical protein